MRSIFLKIFIAAITLSIGIVSVYIWVKPTPKIVEALPTETPTVEPIPQNEVQRTGDSLIKNDGWLLPDISKLKKPARSRIERTPAVYLRAYEMSEPIFFLKNRFDGTVSKIDEIKIKKLWVYDIDERVFCYRMLYSDVTKPGESAVGLSIYYTFYDLDGDGKFETWAINDSTGNPLKMPVWVKN